MVEDFWSYFEYPFVRYAVAVGVLVALCSALLGVVLVLRRFSFIGDGLSHVAFGALAIATVLKIENDLAVVLPVTVLCAVLLLGRQGKAAVRGDSALAMMSAGALAVGYLLLNVFPSSANISGDVCTSLFGSASILSLSQTDVMVCAVMSAAVLALFVLFYYKIFLVTFDPEFAAASGVNVGLFNLLLSVVGAVVIVLAMNFAGSLLTSALIVFPAVSAMRVFKSFKAVMICAACFAVFCAFAGIMASIAASAPVGAAIVAAEIVGFAVFSVAGRLAGR